MRVKYDDMEKTMLLFVVMFMLTVASAGWAMIIMEIAAGRRDHEARNEARYRDFVDRTGRSDITFEDYSLIRGDQ